MKGKIKRVHPKTSYKRLMKELDTVFSLYIRARDGHCLLKGWRCRCGGPLQCNHLISRKVLRLRWDAMNAVAGCAAHNGYSHWNQIEWYDYWNERWPEWAKYIKLARHDKQKYSSVQLQLLIDEYKRKMRGTT
jgi:hypothetical protein